MVSKQNKGVNMKSLTLRLDDELYEALKKYAEAEDRSINKTIIYAIKKLVQK